MSRNSKELRHYARLMLLKGWGVAHVVKDDKCILDELHFLCLLSFETPFPFLEYFLYHGLVDCIKADQDII